VQGSPTKIRAVKELPGTPGELNYEEKLIIIEKEEELARCGNFERIFPVRETFEQYSKYFKVQRAANLIYWRYLKMGEEQKKALVKGFLKENKKINNAIKKKKGSKK